MNSKSSSHQGFWHTLAHKRIALIAFPMLLSNITTPLIGLVDIAVLGHMQGTHILAGAAVGAFILTQLYWVCGFIRMSTTGLSAQAFGQNSITYAARVLYQGLFVSFCLGFFFFIFRHSILEVGLYFAETGQQVKDVIRQYFLVRIYGAPAALANLAVIGWLIGRQRSTQVMFLQIVANLLNVVLNLYFVFVMQLGVEGVAMASVIAEYGILLGSLVIAVLHLGWVRPDRSWFSWNKLSGMLKLNGDMLFRNLALQACLAFITFKGIQLGQTVAAVNAIIMQFFVLIALGLDAVAYAVEALVGEGVGKKNTRSVYMATNQGLLWSSVFAILYTLAFFFAGPWIILLLTDLPQLYTATLEYLPIVWLLPLVCHWCFLFDGVFVGLTRGRAMRNSMMISAIGVFFPVWFLVQNQGNNALWFALLAFMLARGVTLGAYFYFLYRRRVLIH